MISEETKKCIIIILGVIIIIITINTLATIEGMENVSKNKNVDVVDRINKTFDNAVSTVRNLF